jgi:N-acetylmuramoyl-L-alanine amidase
MWRTAVALVFAVVAGGASADAPDPGGLLVPLDRITQLGRDSSSVSPSHGAATRTSKERHVVLVLDPGHGGKDRGGFGERGFSHKNDMIPEDAYTYDVARRVARLAKGEGWTPVFTVVAEDADRVPEGRDGAMLPARRQLFYNLGPQNIVVFPGKEGLRSRLLAASRAVQQFPAAVAVFISLHFDLAAPRRSGARIYTAPELVRHPFPGALAETFRERGLGYRIGNARSWSIESEDYLVLTEGSIVPRVLIELGNFNNERDRALMFAASGRETYAEAVTEAIRRYLRRVPRP